MAVAKHKYLMDYIPDKELFKAVIFACRLLKEGRSYNTAIRIASNYYQVDMKDIRHYVAQRGGRIEKKGE